jgi:hypothetical protein
MVPPAALICGARRIEAGTYRLGWLQDEKNGWLVPDGELPHPNCEERG